jgi:hypothetical protein
VAEAAQKTFDGVAFGGHGSEFVGWSQEEDDEKSEH